MDNKKIMDQYSKFNENYFSDEEIHRLRIRCYKDFKKIKQFIDNDDY